MTDKLRVSAGLMKIGVLFVLLLVAYLLASLVWAGIPEAVQELLLVFTLMAGVHLVERGWAWQQFVDWNRDTISNAVNQANESARSMRHAGIAHVYGSRSDMESRLNSSIRGAHSRVWLLGVAFSEVVRLDELLDSLDNKRTHGVDVKLLLLDPLRSPGVYRMVLESPTRSVEQTLVADKSQLSPADPVFSARLFNDCHAAFQNLRSYPSLAASTKFYGQSPSCWMVIIDDIAFYQPYTLGRRTSSTATNLCLGSQMPLLEFQRQHNADVFSVLINHFGKLWVTSDVDMFHMQSRWAAKEDLMSEIMKTRRPWLTHVHQGLVHADLDKLSERRRAPRQLCIGARGTVKWTAGATESSCDATVTDCASIGLGLRLNAGSLPPVGAVVSLHLERPLADKASGSMIEGLLSRSQGAFIATTSENRRVGEIGLSISPK